MATDVATGVVVSSEIVDAIVAGCKVDSVVDIILITYFAGMILVVNNS